MLAHTHTHTQIHIQPHSPVSSPAISLSSFVLLFKSTTLPKLKLPFPVPLPAFLCYMACVPSGPWCIFCIFIFCHRTLVSKLEHNRKFRQFCSLTCPLAMKGFLAHSRYFWRNVCMKKWKWIYMSWSSEKQKWIFSLQTQRITLKKLKQEKESEKKKRKTHYQIWIKACMLLCIRNPNQHRTVVRSWT